VNLNQYFRQIPKHAKPAFFSLHLGEESLFSKIKIFTSLQEISPSIVKHNAPHLLPTIVKSTFVKPVFNFPIT
jgi:hypothetical protein